MNRLHATKDFWLAAMRADSQALQAAVAQVGPEAAVPAHPGRTVADLVEQLTATLHWVRETAPRGVTDRPEPPRVAEPRPEWPEAVGALRRELTGTIETLDALDTDFPAWNWAPQSKTAGFWHRRIAHELSVQRWDAESAADRATAIETKLAADGVNEVLDTWLPAGRRRTPGETHGVAHLVATDVSYEWFVRLRGAGVALLDTGTILDTDDHHARAQATGTASDLLLVLTGRRPLTAVAVSGDARLLSALQVP